MIPVGHFTRCLLCFTLKYLMRFSDLFRVGQSVSHVDVDVEDWIEVGPLV